MRQNSTLGREIEQAAEILLAAGVDSPRLSAEVLASHVLGWDRLQLVLGRNQAVGPEFCKKFRVLVQRRQDGEPVAYLVGQKEFYGRDFLVGPGILVPRPETELIIDLALGHMAGVEGPLFADMGTGSGAIAITLALELEHSTGVGVDLSSIAAATALENSIRLAASRNLAIVQGDFVHPPVKRSSLDLLVSNPPYIGRSEYQSLSREVRDFEPASALVGGQNGLELVQQALSAWASLLKKDGLMLVEIGYLQGIEIASMVEKSELGFTDVHVKKDLAGLDRVLWALKT